MIIWGGAAFLAIFVVTNVVIAQPTIANARGGSLQDPRFLNLLTVSAGIFVAITILRHPSRFGRSVLVWVLPALLLDVVLTYRLIQQEPTASKLLATAQGMELYGSTGASGFYIANSVAILLPAFLARARVSRHSRLSWIVALMVGLWFVYFTGYVLAMVAALLGLSLYLLFVAPRPLQYTVAAVIATSVATFSAASAAPTLRWISERVEFDEVSRRLSDLADLVALGDTTAPSLQRIELYGDSWNAFTSSPILGIYISDPDYVLSGHSTILDVLGGTGILGFSALMIAAIGSYRLGVGALGPEVSTAALRAAYISLLYVGLANPVLNQPAIVFSAVAIVPIICGAATAYSSLTQMGAEHLPGENVSNREASVRL